jgi:hypothetical protein
MRTGVEVGSSLVGLRVAFGQAQRVEQMAGLFPSARARRPSSTLIHPPQRRDRRDPRHGPCYQLRLLVGGLKQPRWSRSHGAQSHFIASAFRPLKNGHGPSGPVDTARQGQGPDGEPGQVCAVGCRDDRSSCRARAYFFAAGAGGAAAVRNASGTHPTLRARLGCCRPAGPRLPCGDALATGGGGLRRARPGSSGPVLGGRARTRDR